MLLGGGGVLMMYELTSVRLLLLRSLRLKNKPALTKRGVGNCQVIGGWADFSLESSRKEPDIILRDLPSNGRF